MSQGPLCPNLSQKVQKEVSQMANRNLSCTSAIRWFKCKLKPPKNTVHCTNIQMVTSGYQFMNLQFVHLSKNMPTKHQLLVKVVAYRKYCMKVVQLHPQTSLA